MTINISPAHHASIAFTIDLIRMDRMTGNPLMAYIDAKILLTCCNRTRNMTLISLALRVLNECRATLKRSDKDKAIAA